MRTAPPRLLPRGLGAVVAGTLLVTAMVTVHGGGSRTPEADGTATQVAPAHPAGPRSAGRPAKAAPAPADDAPAPADDQAPDDAAPAAPSPVAAVVHKATVTRVVLRRRTGSVRGDGTTVYVANRTAFRPGPVRVPLPPQVRMRSWAVVDLDSGRILGSHRPRAHLPQASTMKLLTAVTAMRTIPRDRLHHVTRFEHRQVCSCAGLTTGARYRRNTLLAGMLLPSGNDAAEALAGAAAGDRQAFYRAMNQTARAIGASDTVAKNASGLTARGSHSSARDLVLLLRAALADDTVTSTLGMRSARIATVAGRHRHTVWRGTEYVNKYAGSLGKSGYTTPAKNTLVVVTEIRGHRIATATMGAPSGFSTKGTRKLTVWAADNFAALGAVGRLPGS